MSFDIQKFLRSLKEFDAISISSGKYSDPNITDLNSDLLDKNKRIKVSISRIFSQILSEISNFSSAMNSSISDISISEEFMVEGDKRYTLSTWSGYGHIINSDIQNCLDSLTKLINPESSSLSHFDFTDKISSIIYSGLFGKELNVSEFTYVDEDGNNLFGDFNKIFGYSESYKWQILVDGYRWVDIKNPDGSTYSLNYLEIDERFIGSKVRVIISYPNTSNQTINEFDYPEVGKTLSISPSLSGLSFLSNLKNIKSYPNDLYLRYSDGVSFLEPDLFSEKSKYQESFSDDSLFLSDYSKGISASIKDIGVLLDNIIGNCDEFGRYSEYEGLGNIKGQIYNLKKVFKSEYIDIFSNKINSELLKITSFSNSGSQELFLNVSSSLIELSNNIDILASSLIKSGYKNKEIINDKSYIYGANTRDEIVSQLKKLGFDSQQINIVLSSKDLSCSFVFLSDDIDEKDIYSYFKGGRLAEYIFYLGGEYAISETLKFFISKENISNLFILLDKLQKNTDYKLSENRYVYGNILGSFISLFPEAIDYTMGPDYKKYQKEIVESLINSGVISRSSADLLELVSKKISDPLIDIDFNKLQSSSLALREFLSLLSPALNDLSDKYKNSKFLNSINGLSAKELNILLNNTGGKRSYELSGFLEGIEGGRYQSLVSGFLHAVLLPKTSPALLPANRRKFILGKNKSNASLEELILLIRNVSSSLKNLANFILNTSSDRVNFVFKPKLLTSTIYSINKDIIYTIDNISNRDNFSFISNLQSLADAEKPGTGNSPEIDSSQKRGVLTPPQSRQIESLLGKGTNTSVITSNPVSYDEKIILQKDILSRWVKLDLESLNSLNSIYTNERGSYNTDFKTSQEFESIKQTLTELINQSFINSEKSQYLNIIAPISVNKVKLDNVDICSKLGKTVEVCKKEYESKSKVSSSFGKTLKPSSIPIERPLGTLSEQYYVYSNSPGPKLLESLSNGRIKAYEFDSPSNTEYTNSIDVLPSISFKKGFEFNRILNKEERQIISGLFDLSNNHLYVKKYSKYAKASIDDCRLLSDPIERQLCSNYIKCVKFKSTNNNRYLSYCPESTPGGRYKLYES